MSAEFEDAVHPLVEVIHRQLEHEDGLMVNRLSWLVASQSFLFTAYAIVLNGAPTPRQGLLYSLLPALGLATCGLIYLGILAGVRVTTILRRKLRRHRGVGGSVGETILGTATTHALGLAAPLLLPPLFFVAWVTLLFWSR